MSKREEFEQELKVLKLTAFGAEIATQSLKDYDRGHADGLSEGTELRKELVGALKEEHEVLLIKYEQGLTLQEAKCLLKLEVLIARAMGGEQ